MIRRTVTTLRAAATLALALACACQKEAPAPTIAPIVSDTVEDQGATFKVNVGLRTVAADEAEIIIEMAAAGIEQTDNLVVDVKTHGLVITGGTPDWTGFILPRERYEHRVSYKLLDDEDQGRATVSIRRTLDSTLLWDTELLFERTEGGMKLAG
jgi:hypothetical protein